MMLITTMGITGLQPLISFNYRANKPDRIRENYSVCLLCVLDLHPSCLVSVSAAFAGIFTDNAEYIELSGGDTRCHDDPHSPESSSMYLWTALRHWE